VSSSKARHGKRPASVQDPKPPDRSKKPLWRRTAVWAGGLGTAVVVGVLVNVLTLQAQRVTQPSDPSSASSATITPSAAVSSRSADEPSPTPSGPPLTVLSEDPINIDQMLVWVFPTEYLPDRNQLKYVNSLIESPGLESRPAFTQWFYSRDAYEAGGTSTQVVVQNNRPYPIRIIDMNVIKNCQPPLTGTMFFGAGGAVDPTVGLGFNLDSSDTEAELAQGTEVGQWRPDYFTRDTISIQPGEQQVFDLWAVTSKYACSYEYQATILDGDRKMNQIIEDGNQPFRATALILRPPGWSAYRAVYIGGAGNPPTGAFIRVDPESQKPLI
jgi:hypothetical protein